MLSKSLSLKHFLCFLSIPIADVSNTPQNDKHFTNTYNITTTKELKNNSKILQ